MEVHMPKSLPAFNSSYRSREISVEFLHHPKGITVRFQVDEGDWQYSPEHFWESYAEAQAGGLALGRRWIDRTSANDHDY
jgi:hypothetical protein